MNKLINDLKHLVNPAAGLAKPWRRWINPVKNIKLPNKPNLKMDLSTITSNMEIAYDIQPANGDQKTNPIRTHFCTESVQSVNPGAPGVVSNLPKQTHLSRKSCKKDEITKRTQT